MLAITIERHGPFKSPLPDLRQTSPERRALAEVPFMTDHDGTGIFSPNRGVVRRTIIHHQHQGEMPAQGNDQGGNIGTFVEAGNYRGGFCRSKHGASLIPAPAGIEAKPCVERHF
jgi:hypothetical protein